MRDSLVPWIIATLSSITLIALMAVQVEDVYEDLRYKEKFSWSIITAMFLLLFNVETLPKLFKFIYEEFPFQRIKPQHFLLDASSTLFSQNRAPQSTEQKGDVKLPQLGVD